MPAGFPTETVSGMAPDSRPRERFDDTIDLSGVAGCIHLDVARGGDCIRVATRALGDVRHADVVGRAHHLRWNPVAAAARRLVWPTVPDRRVIDGGR
jgi:hypothetical protein